MAKKRKKIDFDNPKVFLSLTISSEINQIIDVLATKKNVTRTELVRELIVRGLIFYERQQLENNMPSILETVKRLKDLGQRNVSEELNKIVYIKKVNLYNEIFGIKSTKIKEDNT